MYTKLIGLTGLSRPFVLGPTRLPLSGGQLIAPGRTDPRAEGAAQARHDARVGPARAHLISCRAKKNRAAGRMANYRWM